MSIYKSSSLAMIPTAYKDGKLYSIRPTDGSGDFTFSRGSNLAATRVASSGYIEKGRENLYTQSNNFSHSDWTPKAGTFTQGETDPNGGTDAWAWESTNTDPFLYQSKNFTGVHTLSIYVKGVGSTIGADFQIRTGNNLKDITLTGDWQRVQHFGVLSGSVNIGFEYGNPATAGDIVHIYAAQLELGTIATDYIDSGASTGKAGILEDMPRLDYSGGATCPALLLEPQRTNDIPYSEWFGYSGWAKTRCTITDNHAISPEGFQNAALMTATGDDARLDDQVGSSGQKYTQSIYVKSAQATNVAGQIDFAGIAAVTFTANQEWQRVETTNDSFHRVRIRITNSGDKLLVYGAQLEAGTYATSYIPTFGSAVTRSSDKPDTTFTSSIDSSVGFTILGEFKTNGGGGTSSAFFEFRQASGGYIGFGSNGATWRGRLNDGSANELHTSSASILSTAKLALACDGDGFSMYANGTQFANGTTDFSALTSIASLFKRDTEEFGSLRNFQIVIFPSRLTETELASLTTL